MGARAMEMKKVYVTLMALFDVLEILVEQSPTDRLHRQILEEVIKIELMTTCLFLIVNDCCGFVCDRITCVLKACNSNLFA